MTHTENEFHIHFVPIETNRFITREDNDYWISMKSLDLMRVMEHEYFLTRLAKAELVSPTSDECFVI